MLGEGRGLVIGSGGKRRVGAIMQRLGLAVVLAVMLTGCATHRAAQIRNVSEMDTQVARLDDRVSMLEQHFGLIEGKAWNQREDVSYLKGRVEGIQAGVGSNGVVGKPTPRRIQSALKNAGYYNGRVDGKIGQQTKQAVKEFQKANALNADGVVGPKTWMQLAQFLQRE